MKTAILNQVHKPRPLPRLPCRKYLHNQPARQIISPAHRYSVADPESPFRPPNSETIWQTNATTAAMLVGAVWACSKLVAAAGSWRQEASRQAPAEDPLLPAAAGEYISPSERWAETYLGQQSMPSKEEIEKASLVQLLYCAKTSQDSAVSRVMAMEGFFRQAIDRYSSAPGSSAITGLLLVFPTCTIHFLEGDSSAVCALLREIHPGNQAGHRVEDARVVSFLPECSARLFSSWQVASVAGSKPRSRREQMNSFGAKLLSEAESVRAVEDIQLFMRLIATKLEVLPSQDERNYALQDLSSLEASLPRFQTVIALSASKMAPTITEFVEENDIEYTRYMGMLAAASAAGSRLDEGQLEVRRLTHLYKGHYDRQQKQEQARIREGMPSPLSQYYPKATKRT